MSFRSRIVSIVTLFLLCTAPLFAQNAQQLISKSELPNGIVISLRSGEISGKYAFVAIRDSLSQPLALTGAKLGEQDLWLKRVKTFTGQSPAANSLLWNYDREQGRLLIDLSSIRNNPDAEVPLNLVLAPLNVRRSTLALDVFGLSSPESINPAQSQKLVQLNVKVQ